MTKQKLIKRAEELEELMKKEPLYGYPSKSPEIAKTSVTIVKALCEQENLTLGRVMDTMARGMDAPERCSLKRYIKADGDS